MRRESLEHIAGSVEGFVDLAGGERVGNVVVGAVSEAPQRLQSERG